jgi:hypothetical protein
MEIEYSDANLDPEDLEDDFNSPQEQEIDDFKVIYKPNDLIQKFARPQFLKPINADISVMVVDVDHSLSQSIKLSLNLNNDESTIRIFGVTKEEQSVLINIINFSPYFYLAVP